ncbi:CATRA conflict system CASPASE/TPR repeat-associated protein [Micromonospora sp. NPDC049101]|uniref:CATRA conflict system CASPASE/TPR repeat-associated protein n=1 Tax=Micromonospora sp. NPDC049101 TaxID=3155032 RepID=UPI0033F8B084
MTGLPVIDQELVVHLFAPTDGPHAAAAYNELQQLWLRCRTLLGMVEAVPGVGLPNYLPAALSDLPRAAEVGLAAQGRTDLAVQAIVRLHHDVLNLSVVLSPSGAPPLNGGDLAKALRTGWASLDQTWDRVAGRWTGALLGASRVYQAKLTSVDPVRADPDLGERVRSLLPPAAEEESWWRDGVELLGGIALWECGRQLDDRSERRLVVIAPLDRDPQLSAWTWSRGDEYIPPLARHLLHAAKIRYGLRVWMAANEHRRVDGVVAALEEAVEQVRLGDRAVEGAAHPEYLMVLADHEMEATRVASRVRRLRRSVEIALANIRQALGPDADALLGSSGPLADDRKLGEWLIARLDDDLFHLDEAATQARYIANLLDRPSPRAPQALAVAVEPPTAPSSIGGAQPMAGDRTVVADGDHRLPDRVEDDAAELVTHHHPLEVRVPDARSVFVIHGRDAAALKAVRGLLQGLDLKPLDWEQVVARTESAAPNLIDVLDKAFEDIQAAVVLLTPDDAAALHPNLHGPNEPAYETKPTGQARPNVLFEAGMALARYRTRTVIIEIGELRPFSDLGGVNVIKFDGTAEKLNKIAQRLAGAGCAVDMSGSDWLDTDRFTGLDAYTRRP